MLGIATKFYEKRGDDFVEVLYLPAPSIAAQFVKNDRQFDTRGGKCADAQIVQRLKKQITSCHEVIEKQKQQIYQMQVASC